MKRRLAITGLLLACVSSLLFAKGERKTFEVYDFSKGLDSYHNSLVLPDGYVQDSLNVMFDAKSPVSKRGGYTVSWSTKAYSYTGIWTYTDPSNTTWQIVRSSDQLTASNLIGSIVKVATVSVNNIVGEANAFGSAYFVDQTQGVYYWNGTSTTYVAGSPLGSIIAQFHNRLWVTGAAVPNGNQLYGSGYYAGNTWATGPLSTDPVQYSIGLNDNFDNVTAEYVYLDTLYLFKHYAISALYGFDQPSFQISQLTQECGCIDGGSIQTFNGGLKFVSLRGIEDFNGYTCNRISSPIKNKVDPATQNSFNTASWVQQNTSDWTSGTILLDGPTASLSTTTASPNLVLSSGVFTDSTTSNFSSGTANIGIDTTSVSNAFTLKTYIVDAFGNLNNWQQTQGSWGVGVSGDAHANTSATSNVMKLATPPSPTGDFLLQWTAQCLETITVSCAYEIGVVNAAGAGYGVTMFMTGVPTLQYKIKRYSNFPDSGATTQGAAGTTGSFANDQQDHVFLLSRNNTTGDVTLTVDGAALSTLSADTTITTGFSTLKIHADESNANPGTNFDALYLTARSANFTSRTLDSTLSTTTWGAFNATTNGQGTYAYATRVSSASVGGYGADVVSSTGVVPAVATKRFMIYSATITTTSPLVTFPQVSNVNIGYEASTGVFTSACHSIGAVNSFGNLSVSQDLSTGGMISYAICSSANSSCSPEVCSAITANTQITIATNTYVQTIATFTVTASTQIPKLQSETVQWYSGTKSPPMSSTVWDNRYWLSLATTTSDSTNDAVIVLSSRGAFSILDIKAGAFAQYKNALYHADATATGNVYLDNQGFSDNGAAINAYIKTKDFSLGDLAGDDYLEMVYPSALSLGSCPITFQYDMDKAGNLFSLGSVTQNEFSSQVAVRLPFPIDSAHQDFGSSISFLIGTNDAQCDWQFLGLKGFHKERPIP